MATRKRFRCLDSSDGDDDYILDHDDCSDEDDFVPSSSKKKRPKSKKSTVVCTNTPMTENVDAEIIGVANIPQKKQQLTSSDVGLQNENSSSVENNPTKSFDNIVKTVIRSQSVEEIRNMAMSFIRSSYFRKLGCLQPKLVQNPILVELHKKYSSQSRPDIELETVYTNLFAHSAANLELLKYFIYQVYFEDFNSSRDTCFIAFYSGFRNRAFRMISNTINECGLIQPDYNFVSDIAKHIETETTKHIEAYISELKIAYETTCCQMCLKPATHFCCSIGTYCSVTCSNTDVNHQASCTFALQTAPLLIGSRKNNRMTYRMRLKASKGVKMPKIFM